jgi:thymidylate kinase
MMPLILIEGQDCVGKNFLIERFIRDKKNVIIRHFSNPEGETDEERIQYQKDDFLHEFRQQLLRNDLTKTSDDVFIWNRSHIGEWVYGKIYRKYEPHWIFDLEKLFAFDKKQDIFLVLLDADAEFTLQNDDGLSLTTNLEKRKFEIERFQEAFDKSLITNKIKIKVNKDLTTFKNIEEIYAELLDFIRPSTNK